MSWSFHSGQRVVCIDAEFPAIVTALESGRVYTILEVQQGRGRYRGVVSEKLCQVLAEVWHPQWQFWTIAGNPCPKGFDARRFRPLSEARLDQFRAHLAPTPREKAHV